MYHCFCLQRVGLEDWRGLVGRDELMRRLVTADNAPPHHLAFTALQIQLNITKVTMAKVMLDHGCNISSFMPNIK